MSPWPASFSAAMPHAALVPLDTSHVRTLADAAADGALHQLWYTTVPAPEAMEAEIARRLNLRAQGGMLPFAVLDPDSGQGLGMTTYMNIDARNRRVEIGSTWLRRSAQRGPVNTECKLMLLRHAFDTLDCIAVEFRTHVMNLQSRRAIERLGARLDGILRQHMILANGTIRDTAVYSVTAPDWPSVRANLIWQLERPR